MTADKECELKNKASLYSFLASVFLTLPDDDFADSLVEVARKWESSDSRGCNEIVAYAEELEGERRAEAMLELGRDRARLIRGANNDGIEPPYESLYVKTMGKGQANMSVGSLNRFYGDVGYEVSESAKEASDQIGMEFAFMALLLEKRLAAIEEGDEDADVQLEEVQRHFMAQHLGRWAHEYAAVMRKNASTKFYQGIALLIEETV